MSSSAPAAVPPPPTASAAAPTVARATAVSASSPAFRTFKWSLMTGAIFWSAVYKLSESGLKIPDFVYVNF